MVEWAGGGGGGDAGWAVGRDPQYPRRPGDCSGGYVCPLCVRVCVQA